MTTATIELPPKLVQVFSGKYRYRGAYGGRGGGKSFSFAKMTAIRGYAEPLRILCCREVQTSIRDSVFNDIKDAIESEEWLADFYDIGREYIRGKNGTEYIFKGLWNNYRNIKSTSNIDICWVEEAEAVSEQSWSTLIPTIRKPGSEIWLTWNPETEDSATQKRFIDAPPDNSCIVKMNWDDNPWFSDELNRERLWDMEHKPDAYAHIWGGECQTRTDAQIFAGKYSIKEFEPAGDWSGPYFGLDWGFAKDPTAGVKCWIHGNKLYIEHEAGDVGLELDDTADYMIARLPDIEDHVVKADCARPESISFVQRNGLRKIRAAKKWQGSVQDGINHMRSYDEIVIHPRCEMTAREFRLYSYKIDRLSGDILPVVVDLHNHFIDAIRYAIEPIIGVALERKIKPSVKPKQELDAWGRVKRGGGDSWTTV